VSFGRRHISFQPPKMTLSELINMDKVIAKVKEITNRYRTGEEPTMKESSDKAKKIANILSCNGIMSISTKNAFAKIVEIILGEEIPFKINCTSTCFPFGTMIVPLTSRGGHNYTLDKPVLIDTSSNRVALKTNGSLGNTLNRIGDDTRFATDDEIDKFFEDFNCTCGKNRLLIFIGKLGGSC